MMLSLGLFTPSTSLFLLHLYVVIFKNRWYSMAFKGRRFRLFDFFRWMEKRGEERDPAVLLRISMDFRNWVLSFQISLWASFIDKYNWKHSSQAQPVYK